MTRGLSDDALLQQLAGFLAYEAMHHGLDFCTWADAGGFTAKERAVLDVAYMATLPALWPES